MQYIIHAGMSQGIYSILYIQNICFEIDVSKHIPKCLKALDDLQDYILCLC